MAHSGGSLRGGRLAQQALGGGLDASTHGVSELRLRADSSTHSNRDCAELAMDFDPQPPREEEPVRGGKAKAEQRAPRSATSSGQETPAHHKPDAWFVYRGVPSNSEKTIWRWPLHHALAVYFRKWLGQRGRADDVPTLETIALATLGTFAGILAISALNLVTFPDGELDEAIPSFGASAVLIYAVFDHSPLAQPRNFIGGQILSAVVGCSFRIAFGPRMFWLSAPLAVSLAVTLMQLTRTVHPPGGATAFIAATQPTMLPSHGFRFMGGIAIGSFVMLLVALLVDNLHHTKQYPKWWIGCWWWESWWP